MSTSRKCILALAVAALTAAGCGGGPSREEKLRCLVATERYAAGEGSRALVDRYCD